MRIADPQSEFGSRSHWFTESPLTESIRQGEVTSTGLSRQSPPQQAGPEGGASDGNRDR